MNTKERIETEALDLFSVKGYAGVSMRDIAGRVGIKESSIYKHYRGKEDIFGEIKAHYLEKTQAVFAGVTGNPSELPSLSLKGLVEMIQVTFGAFAADGYISKCRKLFMISAPANEEIGRLYAENFITTPVSFNTMVFTAVLKASGKDFDPEAMAYQLYAPVFCILQEYDNGILSMEESLKKIEKTTTAFAKAYGLA